MDVKFSWCLIGDARDIASCCLCIQLVSDSTNILLSKFYLCMTRFMILEEYLKNENDTESDDKMT